MSRPPTPVAGERQTAASFTTAPLAAAYEMRTLHTDAEREEAAALVQDRQRWLTLRRLPVATGADIPALCRDPQTQPTGLFEDGKLLACMIPKREPNADGARAPASSSAVSTPCPTSLTTSPG